jgi:prepilin-type N-terminal cleavage/methylation domain-containing protein
MNNKGVSLVELIVVISVIAILAVALGFSYVGWQGRYNVEKATKELYTDLMTARSMAMTRNRMYFADFNSPAPPAGSGTYRIAEDTNDDGEGDADADGVIDVTGHTILPSFPKTVNYPLTFASSIINFDKRGLVQPRQTALGGTICIFTDVDPDYDCIVIRQTRILMGKIIDQDDPCGADNCAEK